MESERKNGIATNKRLPLTSVEAMILHARPFNLITLIGIAAINFMSFTFCLFDN